MVHLKFGFANEGSMHVIVVSEYSHQRHKTANANSGKQEKYDMIKVIG